MARFAAEKEIAIDAVLKGCQVAQLAVKTLISQDTITKKDNSPVTIADFSVQAVVNSIVLSKFSGDPIVAEEKSKDLEPNAELRGKVVNLVNSVLEKPLTEKQVLDAIDAGSFSGGRSGRFWTLDPIDGTKGFLRNEQYAVCLALIEEGKVVLGVLGCPNLPLDLKKPDGEKGSLFYAVEGQGAFTRGFNEPNFRGISVSKTSDPKETAFLESVEAGHTKHDDAQKIGSLLGITAEPVRMDSQAKYAALSRGDAAIYLRLPTSASYQEKIWDHAAGNVIVREAGGGVVDTKGQPLDFGLGRTLSANKGVIAANASILPAVIDAVGKVLYPSS